MIEILILISLCRKLGEKARAKGHKAGWYQFLLVMFWFGGEVGTALAIGIVMAILGEDPDQLALLLYVGAIAGAAFGAWGAFKIVGSLPDLSDDNSDDDRYDDDYDDERPPRRRESAPPGSDQYRPTVTDRDAPPR
jgi:hypothetical protein